MTGPRVAIVAGELSGDLLAAGLMRELRSCCPDATFEGIGGPAMAEQGLASRVPMEKLSLMGVTEILGHLPELLRLRRELVRSWRDDPPDVFIGVDLPDFNLSLAKRLRRSGIATVHYVSPTVWAWRRGRLRGIRRAVSRMLTLYPFEQQFYLEADVDAVCVGHPAADRYPRDPDVAAARRTLGHSAEQRLVALLPGSRASEVERLLPAFLGAARRLAQRSDRPRFVIPVASPALYQRIADAVAEYGLAEQTRLLAGGTAEAVTAADVAITASGTATLEVMLAKRPMVVAYRLAPISYWLVRWLIRVPWVSQPNLLAGEALVPELFQGDVEPQRLADEAQRWLDDEQARAALVERFYMLHDDLARGADHRAAAAVLEVLDRGRHER